MSPVGVTTVFDAPCKCGKGRFVVTKEPPAPEFDVEIFPHLNPSSTCPDCAKKFTFLEYDGSICLVRTADVSARKEAYEAFKRKAKDVENLADSIGYYDLLADWLLSFKSAPAVLKKLGDLSMVRYWFQTMEQGFRKAFREKPDTAPMKAFLKGYAQCDELYEMLNRAGKSFPELERLIEVWQQQDLPIVPIFEKLCPYYSLKRL